MGLSLYIEDNTALTSVHLPAFESAGRHVHVSNNDALTDLSGLGSLDAVLEDLEISGNDSLTSFDLSNLDSVERDLAIHYNAALCQGYALEFVETVDVGGNVRVGDNHGECE